MPPSLVSVLTPRPWSAALAAAAAALAVGCQSTRPAAQVVAGDGVLCDLTRRLAAGDLAVECLLQPGDDPHQFRLTPRQSRSLSQAQLLLINGYGLTPALAPQASGAGSPPTVAVAEQAVPASPELGAAHPEPEHDDEHGHGDRDPHVWHDPRQATAMVQLVARRLEVLQPAARPRIAARAAAMEAVLADLHRWNRQQLATIPGPRVLATGHRAFASLARAYGLQELPLVDGSSSSDSLRPQQLQAVVEHLQRQRLPVLLAEQQPPSRALQRISTLSGIPLAPEPLVADGLAKPDGDLIATLTANTCRIATGLGGRCDRQGQQQLIQRWQAIR